MPNPNIKPRITKENAREMQARGVAKHKENIAKRKAMKQTLDLLLNKAIKKGKMLSAEDIQSIAEAEGKNITAQEAMSIAMIQRAIQGDVSAFTAIRDTVGEKPTDKVEVDASKTIEAYAKSHKVKL